MATKQGGLLLNLGKRLLGFGTSSACCAAPAAEAPKAPEKKVVQIIDAGPAEGACCGTSCCASEAPAETRR